MGPAAEISGRPTSLFHKFWTAKAALCSYPPLLMSARGGDARRRSARRCAAGATEPHPRAAWAASAWASPGRRAAPWTERASGGGRSVQGPRRGGDVGPPFCAGEQRRPHGGGARKRGANVVGMLVPSDGTPTAAGAGRAPPANPQARRKEKKKETPRTATTQAPERTRRFARPGAPPPSHAAPPARLGRPQALGQPCPSRWVALRDRTGAQDVVGCRAAVGLPRVGAMGASRARTKERLGRRGV